MKNKIRCVETATKDHWQYPGFPGNAYIYLDKKDKLASVSTVGALSTLLNIS